MKTVYCKRRRNGFPAPPFSLYFLTINYLLSKLLIGEKAHTDAAGEFAGYTFVGAMGLSTPMGPMHDLPNGQDCISYLIASAWNFVVRKLLLYRN